MKTAIIFNGQIDNMTLKRMGDTFSSQFIPSLMKTTEVTQNITVYVGRTDEDTEIVNRSKSFNSLETHVKLVPVLKKTGELDLYSKIASDNNTYVVSTTADFESFVHKGWLSASQEAVKAYNGIGLSLCSGTLCRTGLAVTTSHHLRLFPTFFPTGLPDHLRFLWLKQIYDENDCHCALPCGAIKKQKNTPKEESSISYSEILDNRVEEDAKKLRLYKKDQIKQLNSHLEDMEKELDAVLESLEEEDMENVD